MRAQSNGNPLQCATNLLHIIRGEVPNDRIRGLSSRHFDRPVSIISDDLRNDARWLIKTYEPRVNMDNLLLLIEDPALGQAGLSAQLSNSEVTSDV